MSAPFIFSPHTFKNIILAGVLEFGPVLLFLCSFQYFHIYKATFVLMIATIISTFATYIIQKRLPYIALYVAFLTIIFGYITITHQKPGFIQIRDTLYDASLALTLLIGLMINVPFLKHAFNKVLPMTTRAWNRLTYSWIAFFVVNGIANEFVRRTMDLHQWFQFKGIVIVITIVFGCVTLYFEYEKEEYNH